MPSLPLHRVATAQPFFDVARDAGAPLDRLLRRSGLPTSALDDPDYFIPSREYWDFVAATADHEGIEDLGAMAGLGAGANAVDPGLEGKLLASPTLWQALATFCNLAGKEISRVALWMQPAGAGTHCLHYQLSFGQEHPAFVHFQWYGLMSVIQTVRLFNGPRWTPKRIGLMAQSASKVVREILPNTKFELARQSCYLSLDNSNLFSRRSATTQADSQAAVEGVIEPAAQSLSCALGQVLRTYLADGPVRIDWAAEIAGVKVRTLQRLLAEDNLTYRALVDGTRVHTATDLLRCKHYSVADVASMTGYTDPSHFARAFRRVTGMSPSQFRNACGIVVKDR